MPKQMTKELELSDRDFLEAIIKMLQWTIKNTLEKWKIRKPQQRKRRYKEEPCGNFESEKYNNQNLKVFVGGFNSRMEEREERKDELEEKTIEITQFKHRFKRLKKKKEEEVVEEEKVEKT